MTLRNAIAALAVAALVLCGLLWLYFPALPRSVLGWIALVGLGLPVWALLEWLGEAVLGSRFFARRSSGFRILLGVPVCLALIAFGMACVWLVQAAVQAA